MSLYPMRPVIEATRPFLSTELVDERAWSDLLAVAARLPAGTVCHNLECRLGEGQRQVDLLTVAPSGPGAWIYAGQGTGQELDPALLDDPRWGRIRRLFRAWLEGELSRFAPNVWLEFDIDDTMAALPVPQLGLCVHPDLFYRPAPPRPPVTSAAFREPTEAALALVRGEPLSLATLERLRACIAEAEGPGGAGAVHLGITTSRNPNILRVVTKLRVEDVPGYLNRIGWRGPMEKVHPLLDGLCRPQSDVVVIDVDLLGEEILPKFAAFIVVSGREKSAGLPSILDQLVELRLCSPQKRDALSRWPGSGEVVLERDGWPVRVHRGVDFKLVIHPDGRLEAKGYLVIQPVFSVL